MQPIDDALNQSSTAKALRVLATTQMSLSRFLPMEIGSHPLRWLQGRALVTGMIALIHTDDGVHWGITQDVSGKPQLIFPNDEISTYLDDHPELIQMVRVFDLTHEYFIWRVSEGLWSGRCIVDTGEVTHIYFDEPQVLWGTRVILEENGFVTLADGEQGLHHRPPLVKELGPISVGDEWNHNPIRLGVRHYVGEDEVGVMRSQVSRLTSLKKVDRL